MNVQKTDAQDGEAACGRRHHRSLQLSSERCNKYIDETMPWALAKDEAKQDRLATVLYNLTEGICHWNHPFCESFMPDTTERILVQFKCY